MTPSWGDPKTAGRDVTPVTTPMRNHVIDVSMDYVAPNQPGQYWILLTAGRSRSWQRKTFGDARVDYDTNCRILPQGREVPDVFYCAEWMTMFGIEVVVK